MLPHRCYHEPQTEVITFFKPWSNVLFIVVIGTHDEFDKVYLGLKISLAWWSLEITFSQSYIRCYLSKIIFMYNNLIFLSPSPLYLSTTILHAYQDWTKMTSFNIKIIHKRIFFKLAIITWFFIEKSTLILIKSSINK